MPEPPPPAAKLSGLLRDLADAPVEAMTLGDLVDGFGPRAFGALLFIFAFACALPLPPGTSTLLGAPLVLLSPQVAMGRHSPWLPRSLRRRPLPVAEIRRVARSLAGPTVRIERVSGPRLGFMFGPIGERLIGALCTLLSLVLVLPIPLGNVLPSVAVGAFSLALVQRDGLLALAGYLLTIASTAVLVVAAHIVVRTARHLVTVFAGA